MKGIKLSPTQKETLANALVAHGLRCTRQRSLIYSLMLDEGDHPTVEMLLARARRVLPTISMATVYNSVESLAQCGLIRPVHLERQATRYCPFKKESPEHAHFFCTDSGKVMDIDLSAEATRALKALLPSGLEADTIELCFRGKAKGELATA